MSGFNPATLANPIINQRSTDAPEPMPDTLEDVLDRRACFIAQYLDPTVQFENVADHDPAEIQNVLTIIRNSIAPAEQLVGMSSTTMTYYSSLVWIIPDTRGVLATLSTNPKTAGVLNVHRLLIFWLRPVRINPVLTTWIANTNWHAVLISNQFGAPSTERPAIPVPKIMLLSEAQLLKGFVTYEACRDAFQIAYPVGALFCKMTPSGLPISPALCEAATAAVQAPAPRLGPSAFDSVAATQQAQHEGRAKAAGKDAGDIATFRGTSNPEVFRTLVSPDLPVFHELIQAVRIKLATIMEQCHPADHDLRLLLRGQLGSIKAVTNPSCTSITILFQARPTIDFQTLVETLSRTSLMVLHLMGAVPFSHFQALSGRIQAECQPTTPSYPDTKIGVKGAIDIVNTCFFKVFHSMELKQATPDERWAAVVANAPTSPEWSAAHTDQTHVNNINAINAALASGKHNTTDTMSKTLSNARKQKQAAAKAAKEAATSDPKSALKPPPRCNKQDSIPDGCPYGINCRYTHDDDHPKVDNATDTPPGSRNKRAKK